MRTGGEPNPMALDRRLSGLSPEKRRYLEQLLRQQNKRSAVAASAIPRRRRADTAPLSYAQQRLWIVCQLTPDSPFYNETFSLRFRQQLDVTALERSINEIVRRHEVLRTGFRIENGTPVQVISPTLRVALKTIDLAAVPAVRREVEAQEVIRNEAMQPFDLNRDVPFMRMALIRMGPDDHVFLLTMHHIICDGWAMGVFSSELAALYDAFSHGLPSPLPELPIQYADYAVWQRSTLAGSSLDRNLTYWREQLASLPTLELPTDRPRPAMQSYAGGRVMVVVPPRVHAGLTQLSKREGVTLFVTLLAAFQVLLHRHSGQDDIVVGVPTANRTRVELEGLIGFFVNTLVMRSDLSGAPTFRELIARVGIVATGAFACGDVPFERLVEELHPERDLSRNPLFQVAFQLFASVSLGGGGGEPETNMGFDSVEIGTAKFDLRFDLYETNRGLDGHLEYCSSLFDRATIQRMVGQYLTLLEAVVADPDTRIDDLPLLTTDERVQLTTAWNSTEAEYARDTCVHDLVAAQAQRAPQAAAIVSVDGQLTYAELDRRAGQLAGWLSRQGVGPEVTVACCFERSAHMVVAQLAILKAGGAYLPLDPGYPRDRLADMIEDGRCAIVLTHARARDALPETAVRCVCLDTDWEALADAPGVLPSPSPRALAYVIYTSGSTGRPRGVEIEHRSLMNLVSWHTHEYRTGPGDIATLLAGPAFDASVWELWPYLASGATICIPDEQTLAEPQKLWGWLADQRITHCFLPTPLAEVMLDEPLPTGLALRVLLTGGDRLHARPAAALPFRFVNHYGPTENTVVTTFGDVKPAPRAAQAPTIGRAISNTKLYVLDAHGSLVPIGVPGELYVSGDGLARGYRGRPELTAERFVSIRVGDGPRMRMYRTGDVVRYLPSGELEFLGRCDRQIKLRGFRVEPGEIESHLRSHPRVAESVVDLRESAGGDKRLIAYVVLRAERHDAAGDADGFAEDRVAKWQTLYEDTYGPAGVPADPTFNNVGWNSSYTGAPLPTGDLAEQVKHTVDRILALRPRRVLEIGCGTGLLLLRLAPHCARYVGTDFSRAALDYLHSHLKGPDYARVELLERLADDVDGLDADAFDLVILNSTIQYFPDVEYLRRILHHAARLVAPGGHVFVGDVRNLGLLPAFHAGVELFQAPAAQTVAELHTKVLRRAAQEPELVVDPALFAAFRHDCTKVGAVEVQLKRGRCHNELTAYRYDAILAIGTPQEETAVPVDELYWHAIGGLPRLAEILRDAPAAVVRIRNVPNQRVIADVRAHDLLGSPTPPATCGALKHAAAREGADAVDPEAIWQLAADGGFEARIGYSAASDAFDVVLQKPGDGGAYRMMDWGVPVPPDGRAWHTYANDPLAGEVVRTRLAELREFVRGRLPDYMIPSAFVVLDALPLTPNGKVDRRALRDPDEARRDLASDFVAPTTALDKQIATLWQELLGIEHVGVHDNFFDLGGHSLLIVRMHSRLAEEFGAAALKLTDLFQHTTVSMLSRFLAMGAGASDGAGTSTSTAGSQTLGNGQANGSADARAGA